MTDRADTPSFTVYIPRETIHEDDVVVARALSGPAAIKTALELDGSWSVHLWEDEYDRFSSTGGSPTPSNGRTTGANPTRSTPPWSRRRTMFATVRPGMSMIVDQFMRRNGNYSKAHVETDDEFDKRLLHVAKRREVHRLDKAIATALIDALLAEAYVVTDVSYEEFECSTDREAILEILLDVDRIELLVERNDEESWMRLIFGENGWDLIQDYTVDLGYLIDPIVEPLLPWKRAKATASDADSASS